VELVRRAATGAMTMQQLRLLVRDVETARAQAERRLAALSTDQAPEHLETLLQRLRDGWERLNATERHDLVHAFVSRITVNDGAVDVTLRA
jgi:hypothetical protein